MGYNMCVFNIYFNDTGTKMPKQIGLRENEDGTEGLLRNRNRMYSRRRCKIKETI